jgi:hypothetical protein
MANDQFRNALAEYRKVAQKGLDDQRDKVLAIANDQESAAYKKFNDERDKIDLLAEEAHKRLDERLEEIEAEIKLSMENAKASIYEAATVVGEKAFDKWHFAFGDTFVSDSNNLLYEVVDILGIETWDEEGRLELRCRSNYEGAEWFPSGRWRTADVNDKNFHSFKHRENK